MTEDEFRQLEKAISSIIIGVLEDGATPERALKYTYYKLGSECP